MLRGGFPSRHQASLQHISQFVAGNLSYSAQPTIRLIGGFGWATGIRPDCFLCQGCETKILGNPPSIRSCQT
jgi:hypothetical protein